MSYYANMPSQYAMNPAQQQQQQYQQAPQGYAQAPQTPQYQQAPQFGYAQPNQQPQYFAPQASQPSYTPQGFSRLSQTVLPTMLKPVIIMIYLKLTQATAPTA